MAGFGELACIVFVLCCAEVPDAQTEFSIINRRPQDRLQCSMILIVGASKKRLAGMHALDDPEMPAAESKELRLILSIVGPC